MGNKTISYKKIIHWGILWVVVMIGSLLLPVQAWAIETDPDGQIERGQVIEDDLFMGGERVVLDGTVRGDFYASANTIVINGEVQGSAFLAAQAITINGNINGSLYAASQSIDLEEQGRIGRNLFYVGFALHTRPGSQVGKDAVFAGYQAILGGQIRRDVLASVGALELNGEVGRDVRAVVGDPEEEPGMIPFYTPPSSPPIPSGLRINEGAKIGGNLIYSSGREQSEGIKSKPQGEIIYKPIETQEQQPSARGGFISEVGKYLFSRFQELVTLFILGLVGIWALPKHLQGWRERLKSEPLLSGLNGLFAVLVGYVGGGLVLLVLLAVVIFFATLRLSGLSGVVLSVGFSALGLALAIFTLIVIYGSKVVVSLWLGEWTLNRFAPQLRDRIVLVLLVGALIYVIVRSIPILGWIIGLLATLVGVGAIYLALRDRLRPQAKSTSTAESLSTGG
ncbi:MAG: hypothetical protein RML93_06465 [Anaerolineales bacterium]|nr:hypothetical protein [Anaerolineales bacterium]MDW8446918.1 hypothetical protein [Anaerolineales bacterium]